MPRCNIYDSITIAIVNIAMQTIPRTLRGSFLHIIDRKKEYYVLQLLHYRNIFLCVL